MLRQCHSIGITKETMSITFTVKDFSFIFATHSRELSSSVDPRSVEELSVNAVSSGDVLKAGPYSFRISIGPAARRPVPPHSMLGVAVERVDRGMDIVAVSFELKLWNQRFREKSVVMSTEAPLGIGERGLKGWFPAPYADHRESADGFVLLKEVLDPTKGWLENDSLVVECSMTVGVSQPHPLDQRISTHLSGLEDLSSDLAQLLDNQGDVCLKVGEDKLLVHSLMLSTRSPVFKAMLSHSMKEQSTREVEIEDLDATAVLRNGKPGDHWEIGISGVRHSPWSLTPTASMEAVEQPWFVPQKVLLLLKLKLQNNQDISQEALRALAFPGDNDDDEVLVPVDYGTLEEGFGVEELAIDEDGRMDIDFLIEKFGEKGVAEAFVKAQQVWLQNPQQLASEERAGPLKVADWKLECAAVWGEEGEEEEQLEEDPEPVDAEDAEDAEDVEPPAKRRVVAKSP
eukprot:symbB.v1.2.008758.t2/scaffold544.1/size189386/15